MIQERVVAMQWSATLVAGGALNISLPPGVPREGHRPSVLEIVKLARGLLLGEGCEEGTNKVPRKNSHFYTEVLFCDKIRKGECNEKSPPREHHHSGMQLCGHKWGGGTAISRKEGAHTRLFEWSGKGTWHLNPPNNANAAFIHRSHDCEWGRALVGYREG